MPQRTAERRLVAPTPKTQALMVWVVEMGAPTREAPVMTMAAEVSAASIRLAERHAGPDSAFVVGLLRVHGARLSDLGRHDEAQAALERAWTINQRLGDGRLVSLAIKLITLRLFIGFIEIFGTMMMSGQHCLASQFIIPVLTPRFLASSDLARMIPCLDSVEPHTATAFPRSEGLSIVSTEA